MNLQATKNTEGQFTQTEIISIDVTLETNQSSASNSTVVTSFDLASSLYLGLFASIIFIGGMFGSLYGMLVGSFFGRKLSMIFCCLLYTIGAVGASASQSYASVLVFRAIMGLGCGITTTMCSVYCAELMPFQKYQGVLGAMFNMGISSGSALAYVVAAIFVDFADMWRAVHAFANVASIVLFIIILIMPESPQFKKEKQHEEAAPEKC